MKNRNGKPRAYGGIAGFLVCSTVALESPSEIWQRQIRETGRDSMRDFVIGILAHVDAGKTTLSEALLYESGARKNLGRVDHQDSFLDSDAMERERGITIFSKQALFTVGDSRFTLLDTPGHADFSAEMERTLSVLDMAILLVSAKDGVQGHTETIWRLLNSYHIPALIFVNKMDQDGAVRETVLQNLRKRLSGNFMEVEESWLRVFREAAAGTKEEAENILLPEELAEELASWEEALMEQYFDSGRVSLRDVQRLFRERKLSPVFFGSALHLTGVSELTEALPCLAVSRNPFSEESVQAENREEERRGIVFKITRGRRGERLSYVRLFSGTLTVRQEIREGEKIHEIRLYDGESYQTVDRLLPGMVGALTGIESLQAGDRLEEEEGREALQLLPVLDYTVTSEDADIDGLSLYRKLHELSEEFPELSLSYQKELREIHVRLMGEIQTEILSRMIRERCDVPVHFSDGEILYRETITDTVEGIGHFEPLRHYAEVHLLLEPLPRNSGIEIRNCCPDELLSKNWQRTVVKLLSQREHPGVLMGAPISDMRITLLAGRAHPKHTEGGDFREATYRALRMGLRKANSVLLEPAYHYELTLPSEQLGRAMTELSRMDAGVSSPETLSEERSRLSGSGTVQKLRDYHKRLLMYSGGRAVLHLTPDGYVECRQIEEVLLRHPYHPEADPEYPSSSVFCIHGSSEVVPYQEVERYMHVLSDYGTAQERQLRQERAAEEENTEREKKEKKARFEKGGHYIGSQELENIFIKTYGKIKNRAALAEKADQKVIRARERERNIIAAREERERKMLSKRTERREFLLIDGYNIIFSWEELKELAEENLDAARLRLLDIVSDYQGYTGLTTIVVFDAYLQKGHLVESFRYHNVEVVFTKEAQTADQYIESLTRELSVRKPYSIRIATSDKVVQVIVWSSEGVFLYSAGDFEKEVKRVQREVRTEYLERGDILDKKLPNCLRLP